MTGDSNGHGEFKLVVGFCPIAHIAEALDPTTHEKTLRWFSLDRGSSSLAPKTSVRAEMTVNIPIRRGDEPKVFVEIANSSWADVTLSGRFAPDVAKPTSTTQLKSGRQVLKLLETFRNRHEGETQPTRSRVLDPSWTGSLRPIVEAMPEGPFRTELRSALSSDSR